MQEFLVAVGVRGATLQHRVVPPSLGWYDQVVQPGAATSSTLTNFCYLFIFTYMFREHLKKNNKSDVCNLIANFCTTDCRLSECF